MITGGLEFVCFARRLASDARYPTLKSYLLIMNRVQFANRSAFFLAAIGLQPDKCQDALKYIPISFHLVDTCSGFAFVFAFALALTLAHIQRRPIGEITVSPVKTISTWRTNNQSKVSSDISTACDGRH